MCGIYGYIGTPKKGKEKTVLRLMKSLAINTEHRGTDSTGFIAMTDKEFVLEKACVRAKYFVKESEGFTDTIKKRASIFIGHNRWASIGNIEIKNAHPFVSSKFALVHNGTFEGAKSMAKRMKAKTKGTTDSEAMLMCLTKTGIKKDMLAKFNDYSLVILDLKTKEVYFARDDHKPMFIFDMRKSLGIYVFASEVEIVYKALKSIKHNSIVNYNSTRPYELTSIKNMKFRNHGNYKKQMSFNDIGYFGRRGYPAPSPSKGKPIVML